MEHITQFNAAGLEAQNREDVRDSLFIAAIVRKDGACEYQAHVRNLSAGGMMADCDAHFANDEEVCVVLRGIGDVSGRVAWTRGKRIGIAFDREIDPKAARKPVGKGASGPSYPKPVATRRPGLRTE